jgi:outer membrane protein assembly factor BamB
MAFWLIGVAVCGYAQELTNGQWLSRYRDHLNSVNTPVRLSDTLNILWERPAGGWVVGEPSHAAIPLVHDGMVVSGNCVYDAWSGDLIHYFPDAGDQAAITDGVLLTGKLRSLGESWCYEYFAYDLNTFELLWHLDPLAAGSPITVSRSVEMTGKDETFFVAGKDRVAAISARPDPNDPPLTANPRWERVVTTGGYASLPCVAEVMIDGNVVEVVYVSLLGTNCLYALDASNGGTLWVDSELPVSPPSVDPVESLVFTDVGWVTSETGGSVSGVRARDASNGEVVWEEEIDKILNGPLTLGKVFDPLTSDETPAVFAVTGGNDTKTSVYAIDRRRGEPAEGQRVLWRTEVQTPSDTFASAVYSGGKLYFADHYGRTYELDANTGLLCGDLDTGTAWSDPDLTPRVIVDLSDDPDVPQSVMYYLMSDGYIAAWSESGSTTPREAFILSVEPVSAEIPINSSTTVTATLLDGKSNPIEGAEIAFRCDAESNKGFVSPTSATTDENGVATTTFTSERRTGTVTITEEVIGIGTTSATTAISVVKDAGEEPPPDPTSGGITGKVTENGRVARKATVSLFLGSPPGLPETPIDTTTTDAKGMYTFTDLPPGTYTVEATKEEAFGFATGDVPVGDPVTWNIDML